MSHIVNKLSLTEAYPEIIAEIQREAFEKGFSEGEAKMKEGMAQEIERVKSEGIMKRGDFNALSTDKQTAFIRNGGKVID